MGLWAHHFEFVFSQPVEKEFGQEFQGCHLWMTLGKCISFFLCRKEVIVLSPPFQSCWEEECEWVLRALSFPEKGTESLQGVAITSPVRCIEMVMARTKSAAHACHLSLASMLPVSHTAYKQICLFTTSGCLPMSQCCLSPYALEPGLFGWLGGEVDSYDQSQRQLHCYPTGWPWICHLTSLRLCVFTSKIGLLITFVWIKWD